MNIILKAAREYALLGWHVFPLHTVNEQRLCSCGNPTCTDAGKHPRTGRGLKDASRDLDKIEEWFGDNSPPSNIGIVTGEISGITVIDIDIAPGKFGAESWAEIVAEHGEPDTLMCQTGSGGMHLFFQYNSALKTASNVLGKGIDSRNDGGYVVAAPSAHRSGSRYKWLNWDNKIAPLPAFLALRKETRGRPKRDDIYRGKYSIEQVCSMLEVVPSDDRDLWRSVGIILGREFKLSDEAWQLYADWSNKYTGKKGRNHDEIMHQAFYELSQQKTDKELTLGTIVKAAIDNGWAPKGGEVPIDHFVYFAPGNSFIYRPTGTYWIGTAVDAACSKVNIDGKLKPPSEWLKAKQLCTSITSDPKIEEDYKKGFDCRDGEILTVPGAALYNTYRKPTIELGDAKLAGPFLEHVKLVFPNDGDAEQFLNFMAHRVQRPWEKPRFALLLAGEQGVGKDTAVEFCCPAIGAWNVANIEPMALESQFNEFSSSTLVRISEAANLHEMTKWAFNERMKVLIAGSPDNVTINPKYGHKYSVRMYCGVIITTNHLTTGIYIPAGDRRYDVIQSATFDKMGLTTQELKFDYFSGLWDWFINGGANHIAAYLNEKDISGFSASNGQRKTEAWKTVIASGYSGDTWLDDALCELKYPDIVRIDWIITIAVNAGMKEESVKRTIQNAMERADYSLYRNPDAADGRFKLSGKKVTVYLKKGANPPKNLDSIANEKF